MQLIVETKSFDSLNSTQDYLLENIDEIADFGVVSTKRQTAGYGRTGVWDGSLENIYMSIKLPTKNIEISELILLSLFEVCQSLQYNVRIKLPNDLYINQQKLSGFIVNQISDSYVIGIGLNTAKTSHIERIGLNNLHELPISNEELVELIKWRIYQNYQLSETEINLKFNRALNINNTLITVINRETNEVEELFVKYIKDSQIYTSDACVPIIKYKFR